MSIQTIRHARLNRQSRTTKNGRLATSCALICASRCRCHDELVPAKSMARHVSDRARFRYTALFNFAVEREERFRRSVGAFQQCRRGADSAGTARPISELRQLQKNERAHRELPRRAGQNLKGIE